MSCTRGCVGTPICSALDLCCIQFRQDCGKECGGLASGFSTIQINALGELEVCSNVGGICTCVEVAVGTDQLIDNGDGTLTHTAVDAEDTTFCNGIDTILAVNDCDEGGIGDDYMVRDVTLIPVADSCSQLRLEGAPEHTSLCDSVDAADFTVVPSPGPGGSVLGLLPSNLVVNNPSLCRDMSLIINFTGSMLYTDHLDPGPAPNTIGRDALSLEPVFTVDGAPVFLGPARNSGIDIEIDGTILTIDHATQGWSGCATLAPGDNLVIDNSENLNVDFDATINNIIVQGGSITVMGSTV